MKSRQEQALALLLTPQDQVAPEHPLVSLSLQRRVSPPEAASHQLDADEAVAVLRAVMRDSSTSPTARLRAATELLARVEGGQRRTARAQETEEEQREMEARVRYSMGFASSLEAARAEVSGTTH